MSTLPVVTLDSPGLYLGIGERLEPVACVAVRCGGRILVRAAGDHGWSAPTTRFPIAHWLAVYPIPFPLPDLQTGWFWQERGGWLRGLAAREIREAALPVLLRATVTPVTPVTRENPLDSAQPFRWHVARHALGVEVKVHAEGVAENFAAAVCAADAALVDAEATLVMERGEGAS